MSLRIVLAFVAIIMTLNRNEAFAAQEHEDDEEDIATEMRGLSVESLASSQRNFLSRDELAELQPGQDLFRDGSAQLGDSKTFLELGRLEELFEPERQDELVAEQDIHEAYTERQREKNFMAVVPNTFRGLKKLGQGHNGIVYEAINTTESGSMRNVAIKFLHSQEAGHISRRMREVAAHGFLPPHPNIVRLLSPVRSEEGYEYFVMELCDTSLDKWIQRTARERAAADPTAAVTPTMSAPDVTRLLHELCDAVVTLRTFGMTHRDVKPSNILLSHNLNTRFGYSMKLADFGVTDMQVGGEASHYDNYVGTSYASTGRYSSEHDFRAGVASIFFAWVGDVNWDKADTRRQILMDDNGFYSAFADFELNDDDWKVVDFFERALPMPRFARRDEGLSLDEAVDHLEKLGQEFKMGLRLTTSTTADGLPNVQGHLDDAKLDQYTQFALDVVSGRRKAKDFETACAYLGWVQYLFSLCRHPIHDARYASFYLQTALVDHLPKAQQAVRAFASSSRSSSDDRDSFSKAATAALRKLEKELSTGIRYSRFNPDDGVPGPGPAQFVNLQSLAKLERVKYLKLCGEFERAEREALQGVALVQESATRILDESGGALTPSSTQALFQHCRNEYLLLHEAIIIAHTLDDEPTRVRLAVDAVGLCERGLIYLQRNEKASVGDICEMRRCLAEALYIAGHYQRAREVCRTVFETSGSSKPLRVRVLRVLAIWVAALREIVLHDDDDDLKMELGYVCGLLIERHFEALSIVASGEHSLANARAFLATSTVAAQLANADPLYPSPLLPDVSQIRAHAQVVLSAIEDSVP